MSLAQEYTAAQDATFAGRVMMAAIAFAENVVMTELVTTPNHANRALYAQRFVNAPQQFMFQLARGVIALNAAADGSLLSDVTIGDSVATIWNIYAGVV